MKTLFHNKRPPLTASMLFLVLLNLTSFLKAQAQVSFRNPTYPSGTGAQSEFSVYDTPVDNTSQAVQIPAPDDGELTADFSATLFRPVGASTQGYVTLQLGTSPTTLLTPDLNAAERPIVDNSLWTPALDINGVASASYEQLIVTGTFTISGNLVANNTGFYAVYRDNNGATPVVSRPVLLRILPPDPLKNPLLFYMRCGGNAICGDQCVPYGTKPEVIKGRVLASQSEYEYIDGVLHNRYQDYADICAQKGISTWASKGENEEVIWQYSYDNSNWSNVDDYSRYTYSSSFQPPICTRTTYYRRISSHLEKSWWSGNSQEWWYDSNVVRITPTAPMPTAVQPNVRSCGGAVTVSANTNPATLSYNWWLPYAGWTVSDGVQAPFSTYNNNGSFITNRSSNIIIYPPSNAAPGNYEIYFSANGGCGEKSADGRLTVTIDYGATAAPVTGYFNLASGSTRCFQRYNLYTSPVAGATSYEATLSTGARATGRTDPNTGEIIFFTLTGPLYGVSAEIVAISPCGRSAPYYVPAQDLNYLRAPKGSAERPVPCDEEPVMMKAYPNPATNSLTLQAENDSSKGYLYNNEGKLVRTISLDKANVSKKLDTSEVPSGLYNLIIESPNHERHTEHIVIEH
jgi:hypothetical protein